MKIRPRWIQRRHYVISDIRFLVFMTLVTSLLVTSLTFLSFVNIQRHTLLTDIRFVRDMSSLLVKPIAKGLKMNKEILETSLESIYLSKKSISYIILFESNGNILSMTPENVPCYVIKSNWSSASENSKLNSLQTQINYLLFRNNPVVDTLIPFKDFSQYTYYLNLGISSKTSTTLTLLLLRSISIIVFVSIWFTSILSIIVNNISVDRLVDTISIGLRSIASGNFNKRIMNNPGGRFNNLLLNFNDMARRLDLYEKNNVQQLITEKSKLETLVSIIADGAILLDKDLRVVFINQSAAKTFKFLRSCIRGTHIYTHLPDSINKQLLPVLNQMLESGTSFKSSTRDSTFSFHINDNYSRTFQFVITHIVDHERQVFTGIAIIVQDVTEQISLNEAKNQFISNVSHELRTPLFNIRSFLETLSDYQDTLSNKQQKEFLEIANKETVRLTNLVNDVLDLSRLESEFVSPWENIEVFDIIPLIIQVSQLRACQQNIELSLEICPSVVSFFGYPNLILQVISNLIGNSLKFTKSDGRIVIKLYPITTYDQSKHIPQGKMRIEIIDEGTGIGQFDQHRIFDRFIRLENNVHTLEGTGLGLSIVKNIIEKHHSHICLHSELGSGSSFWFDLCVIENKN